MKGKICNEELIAKMAGQRWHRRMELAPGIFTPASPIPALILDEFLPADLSGMRVLDLGTWDGACAFECKCRGAESVLAIDIADPDKCGFNLARECLGLEVEYQRRSIYDLSAAKDGKFDLILFLGLIYHLRHPLLALDILWDICIHTLLVESQVCDEHFVTGRDAEGKERREALSGWMRENRVAQFYPSNELNGDFSNWFSPNVACLEGWLDSSGFEPELTIRDKSRAFFRAQRRDMPTRPWCVEIEQIGYLSHGTAQTGRPKEGE